MDDSVSMQIRALIAYAYIKGTTLSEARKALGYDLGALKEASMYRINVCDTGTSWITNYPKSIEVAMQRLANAS